MSKKYVVKNCPNLSESYYADGHISRNECSLDINDEQCSNCTDCLIKQVIEKIKDTQIEIGACSMVYVDDILELFEIKDCE